MPKYNTETQYGNGVTTDKTRRLEGLTNEGGAHGARHTAHRGRDIFF